MQLEQKSLKFMNRIAIIVFGVFGFTQFSGAQEIIEDKPKEEEVLKKKKIVTSGRIKADGVAAVVGDYILLDSDVDRRIRQIEAEGGDLGEITRCELFGSMLEEKLYAHGAVQDSILVNELQIRSRIDQQL